MTTSSLHAVTGAFGYSGKYIAARLLEKGHSVRTLTNSTWKPDPFNGRVEVKSLAFDNPAALTESLRGVEVVYNTYWVRFNHPLFTHSQAVQNTLTLFESALKAGVKRVVHISITNPSENSPYEYFRGKAELENALTGSGMAYTILRPTVLFGKEDILINNIAWILRRFPLFGVFGSGEYRLEPIYVDDLAQLAVEAATSRENHILDAIGPEVFTFRELVTTISHALGLHRMIVPLPPGLGYVFGWGLGKLMGDVLITRPEIEGLMAGLLYTGSSPAGATRLTDWVHENRRQLGLEYASELSRRRKAVETERQPNW